MRERGRERNAVRKSDEMVRERYTTIVRERNIKRLGEREREEQ